MNEQEFWQFIAKNDWKKKDDDKRLKSVVEALSLKSEEEIYEFDSILAQSFTN